ncbi:MAG: L-serine ammonia-lyase, iron-sulfur-dependent, subunit alpha [Verrucomicrobiales bacterium]
MNHPSIFNDVLGPVMRGPSSSHSAAALRIGRIARDLMGGSIRRAVIDYDPNGSLVTTHKSQGTDMGLYGGFLGWEADDERLPDYQEHIDAAGIEIQVNYLSYGAKHPNTYRLELSNAEITHKLTAISTGGGMMEVIEIDGHPVAMAGDLFETLVFTGASSPELGGLIPDTLEATVEQDGLVQLRGRQGLSGSALERLRAVPGVSEVAVLCPVMPVLGRAEIVVPFTTCSEMLAGAGGRPLWQMAIDYESARSGDSEEEVYAKMVKLLGVMRAAIAHGLAGTDYEDRILPCQTENFAKMREAGRLIQGDVLNEVILQVSALMEAKSSMGVIVAAPTAGSCGAMPGAVLGTSTILESSDDEVIKALFIAGLIGVFIARGSTFAAEEAGCMAECGSGASMSAAALTFLGGGNLEQSLGAASMALQASLGMICDPIGNRVEAPCLGKNVLAATNAVSCANMALAEYQHLIPLDEVIEAMDKVGKAMPHEHCCTGLGGLAATPAARKIEAALEESPAPVEQR